MTPNCFAPVLGLVTALTFAGYSNADVVIYDWEGTTESFEWRNDFTAATPPSSSTSGVTHGSNSASIDVVGNSWTFFSGPWHSAPLPALVGNSKVEVDIALATPPNPSNFWEGMDAWIVVQGNNADGNAYFQVQGPATRITSSATVSFDYSTGPASILADGTASVVNFEIRFSGAGGWTPGTVYIDNFRVDAVPEPASLALLTLGATAMLRRSRP